MKIWTEADVETALSVIAAGNSIRSTALKYGMSECYLRKRIKMKKEGRQLVGSGRKPTLGVEQEKQLAKCIGSLCETGFSPSRFEIKDMVRDFVRSHKLSTPFKNDRPGKDWLRGFMKRNNLSLKKANMISAARKSATANPFIINDFYDVIERIIKEKNLQPNQIWNCDESGFPTDPQKCRVVGVKGKEALKVTFGAGRENITTLAVCSASGKALDPLIVFAGKNLQSTWRGENPLKDTFYSISQNGWMTTEVFSEWFSKFAEKVTERPLLLILDGHLTHVSVDLVETAILEDITIVKLPPHVTDKLQPLDVTCFGPMKREWERTLNEWVNEHGPKNPMKKPNFVDMLSKIWHKCLSEENVKAGFRATGIYPVNRDRFPRDRLDPRLLKRYDQWVALGKPADMMEDLAMATSTPKKLNPVAELSELSENIPDISQQPNAVTTPSITNLVGASTSTPMDINCSCTVCKQLGAPPKVEPGKICIPVWSVQNAPPVKNTEKSFEEAILDRMKGPVDKPVAKRRKVHMKTKIITDENYLAELKMHETEKVRKKEKKQAAEDKKKEKKTVNKKINFGKRNTWKRKISESTTEDESSDDSIEEETEEEIIESEEEVSSVEKSDEERLKDLWESLSPPISESEVTQKWYGVVYEQQKKNYLYVGKALRRFLVDADGPVTSIQIECLKQHVGTEPILESIPPHLPRDIYECPIYNIIEGPLVVAPLKGDKWHVPDYNNLKEIFKKTVKLDRKQIAENLQ